MTADIDEVSDRTFDYVICGGGTAGLTLAARLSEDSDVSVLVLEAGGTNLDEAGILRPGSWGSHFANADWTWPYKTVKQKAVDDTEYLWFRGKGLGGSSQINFMVWAKPPKEEIDDFERLGNPGWNWKNYQHYVSRTEGFVAPSDGKLDDILKVDFSSWEVGREGPMEISFPGLVDEVERCMVQTLRNAGIPSASQPLSGDPNGICLVPNTYDPVKNTRSYATTAFYTPVADRPNLTVLVHATAHRLNTREAANGKLSAASVEFEYKDRLYSVDAAKDVCLTAGALKTPHILELSGIGRKDILDKISVSLKVELPGVGENVQEHLNLGVSWELKDTVDFETADLLRDPTHAAKHLELHSKGLGLFTKAVIGFAFNPLKRISSLSDVIYEKAKAKIMANAHRFPPGLMEQYTIQLERIKNGAPECEVICFPGHFSSPAPPEAGKQYLSIVPAMNHCFSRGTIHSISSDPRVEPEFDPRYFEQEVDLDILVESVKWVRTLADVAPLKNLIVCEHNPGSKIANEEEIREWARKYALTTWHTAGSCSMLPREHSGVVDPELRVYGTNNVRVVDLSVVPLHFAAHTTSGNRAISDSICV
ncbi:GMC oxidoreductase [Rhodofomes roseus]|uniref:GMC oxidoreductase n=1 Tax=Rhodofomes roseus TaxID=34475 RepID=A0ABQ8KQT7_9APHY|nr:GMC oxidoreductase [Rhodofomes roseus]KAH9840900.1 GMC oxidoreductase [Rhodofomes roseus]